MEDVTTTITTTNNNPFFSFVALLVLTMALAIFMKNYFSSSSQAAAKTTTTMKLTSNRFDSFVLLTPKEIEAATSNDTFDYKGMTKEVEDIMLIPPSHPKSIAVKAKLNETFRTQCIHYEKAMLVFTQVRRRFWLRCVSHFISIF
jgi:hypothetical protein